MSELIDVACDICGKQYRWPDERLGESATCRYCGTKFEVKLFVPPEDDTNAKDLQWFKGVGVAILVVSVAVGLSSLLFIRPGQTGWNTASRHTPPPPTTSWPSTSRPDVAQHQPFHDAARVREMGQFNHSPSHAPGAAAPFIVPELDPATSTDASVTGPPVVTSWLLETERGRRRLRLRGQGFAGTTKVQTTIGGQFTDATHEVISDSELLADAILVGADETTIYAVTNAKGVGVAYSENIATITDRRTMEFGPRVPRLYLIKNGGHFKGERPGGVLVEAGGHAEITPASTAFVKRGGSVTTNLISTLHLEPGASVSPPPENLSKSVHPVITFCRLPAIPK